MEIEIVKLDDGTFAVQFAFGRHVAGFDVPPKSFTAKDRSALVEKLVWALGGFYSD